MTRAETVPGTRVRVASASDRDALRSLLLLVGLSRRWRGLETIARRVGHSSDLRAVREALIGLCVEGRADMACRPLEGHWRLRDLSNAEVILRHTLRALGVRRPRRAVRQRWEHLFLAGSSFDCIAEGEGVDARLVEDVLRVEMQPRRIAVREPRP